MAATGPAIDRIRYLAGKSQLFRQTPGTITGDRPGGKATKIFSYAMLIAWKDNGDWIVRAVEDAPSVTTRRHIRAAGLALNSDYQTPSEFHRNGGI